MAAGSRSNAEHSKSGAADVTLTSLPENLQLSVKDGGIGFDPNVSHRRGLGLISLEERVRPFNGRLLIESERGVGTEILVRIPWATRGNVSPPRLRTCLFSFTILESWSVAAMAPVAVTVTVPLPPPPPLHCG